MSRRLENLAARRQSLVARSERLRDALALDVGAVAARLSAGSRLFTMGRSGPARWLLAAGAAFILFRRPRRVLRTAVRLFALYPALRPLVPKLIQYWRRRSGA